MKETEKIKFSKLPEDLITLTGKGNSKLSP